MYKKFIFSSLVLLCCIFIISCQKNQSTNKASELLTPTANTASPVAPTDGANLISDLIQPTADADQVSQETILMEDVSHVLMKDSENGWVITRKGVLLSTNNGWNTYQEVYQFTAEDGAISMPVLSYTNDTLFVMGFLPGNQLIGVYRSTDNGATWKESHLDYSGEGSGAYQLFCSFTDSQNGYILYSDGPACGLMPLFLYKTTDGGETFQKVGDVSYINGYATGMGFNEKGIGYITTTYHGNDDSYLYISEDQGKTWKPMIIQPPENIENSASKGYVNGYPPDFKGDTGFMIFEYVSEQRSFLVYHSSDAGETWLPDGNADLSSSIFAYSFCEDSIFYVVDESGSLIKKAQNNMDWN